MPDAAHPVRDALTPEERKKLLALACQADRVAWAHACRPRPRPPTAFAAKLLRLFEPILPFVPGTPGRWLQRAGFFARIGRHLGFFRS